MLDPQTGDIWEYNFNTPEYHLTYHLLVLGRGHTYKNYYLCHTLETRSVQEISFIPTPKETYEKVA